MLVVVKIIVSKLVITKRKKFQVLIFFSGITFVKFEEILFKIKSAVLEKGEEVKNITEKYIGASIDRALFFYDNSILAINKAIKDVCSLLVLSRKPKLLTKSINPVKPKFAISAVLISLLILSSFFAFNPHTQASIANLGEEIAEFVFNTGQNIVLLAQDTKKSAGNLFDNLIVKSPQLIEKSTHSIKAISSKTNSNIQDKSISLSKAISNKTSESIQSVPKNTTNLIKGLYENIDKLVVVISNVPEKILKFASSANKENENFKLAIRDNVKNISERIIQIPSQIKKLPNKAIYVFANINRKNENAKLLVVDKIKNTKEILSDTPYYISLRINKIADNLSDTSSKVSNILSDTPQKLSDMSGDVGEELIYAYHKTGSNLHNLSENIGVFAENSVMILSNITKDTPKNISAGFLI